MNNIILTFSQAEASVRIVFFFSLLRIIFFNSLVAVRFNSLVLWFLVPPVSAAAAVVVVDVSY